MHESVTEESICKANAQFWEQMLAMRLEPVEAEQISAYAERCIGTEHLVGSCTLSGAWQGRVEVRLSRLLAVAATSVMLMQPADRVEAGDTLDATKEIANMIAGTLKSALPRPCTMSVPSAEIEAADFCVLPRTEDAMNVFFAHETGELLVRVCEEGSCRREANEETLTICA